ncbi:ATP-binding cassette domain-containing protein [Paenirhodobacter sp.]|uniref:ATP-binding cassette domain-containing protein n=1 Tax=Paenirhodobacter sp. TaxID=1965326 RepID=UPI003B3FE474
MSHPSVAGSPPGTHLWRALTRSPVALAAASMAGLAVLAALIGPLLSPYDPFNPATLNLLDGFTPPLGEGMSGNRFLLGSDAQGRDMLTTILIGSRLSLLVALAATLFSLTVGVSLGLAAGYLGGWIDAAIMRLADIQLTFPGILIALLVFGVAQRLIPTLDDPIRRPPAPEAAALVEVEGLRRSFAAGPRGLLRRREGERRLAVDDVSFTIPRGQTYGLVGESGSGKSTIARLIAGLMPTEAGEVRIDGQPVGARGRRTGRIQMIFQDPMSSLNPRLTVRDIVAEPIRTLGLAGTAGEVTEQVAELLRRVRLEPGAMHRYPHQFSGGQRQRIAIARALSSRPEFIICDEPTSALNVSVQAQVLELMAGLQQDFGLTYLLISHNLAVVRQMADRVGVLSRGRLVEEGPTRAVFDAPQAEYTRALLAAVPRIPRGAGAAA